MTNSQLDVLLVEDTSADAELTLQALQLSGCADTVLWLPSGSSAIEYLFGRSEIEPAMRVPRLLIVDLDMPGANGFEVLERVRTEASTWHIPAVIFSSRDDAASLKAGYASGANGYVLKAPQLERFQADVIRLAQYWLVTNVAPSTGGMGAVPVSSRREEVTTLLARDGVIASLREEEALARGAARREVGLGPSVHRSVTG